MSQIMQCDSLNGLFLRYVLIKYDFIDSTD